MSIKAAHLLFGVGNLAKIEESEHKRIEHAAHAKAIGLVHLVVSPEHLDETLQDTLQELVSSAPQAIRSCKELALTIGKMDDEQARTYTSELIARLRVSEEGQEGLSAFLEKRQPRWGTK
jgi:methylglutaconyl-CoA hydratase